MPQILQLFKRGKALTLVLLVVVNLAFLGITYKNSLSSYVFTSSSESPDYYILRASVVDGNKHLADVVASENLTPIKEDDVISNLLEQLKGSDDDGKLQEMVRESVRQQYESQFKSELKSQMEKDYSHNLFRQMEKSYELLEELKSRYLREHAEEIKDSIVNDYLTEINDANIDAVGTNLNNKISRLQYFQFLFNDFIFANAPKCKPLVTIGSAIGGNMYREALKPGYTKEFLTKHRVFLKPETFTSLQDDHDKLVHSLKHLDFPPHEIFSGEGIVINGGGVYLAGALVTIIQLRELGSKLPIELILNTEDEYDTEVCEQLAPRFNCTCKIIERELGSELYGRLGLKKFQLKTVGLLISSFDTIIALDADNLPIKNPDFLINSEPFLSTKFVLWPDIWHKGTSPLYYDIARFKIGQPIHREGADNAKSFAEYASGNLETQVMFHDLEGTPPAMGAETGQMVFSKRAHLKSFVLSLYYNVYGTSHYYPLIYQGTYGSGDRETFIPALHVMNEPYYINNYQVWFAGYDKQVQNAEGKTRTILEESTMVQHDPLQTIEFYKDWEQWLREQGKDTRLWPFQDNGFSRDLFNDFLDQKAKANEGKSYKLPDALFLHVHKPKINPILNDYKFKTDNNPTDIYVRRYLGKPGVYDKQFGTSTDWELKFNAIAQWVVCEGINSKQYWEKVAQNDQNHICSTITKFVDLLKEDTIDPEAANISSI